MNILDFSSTPDNTIVSITNKAQRHLRNGHNEDQQQVIISAAIAELERRHGPITTSQDPTGDTIIHTTTHTITA